MIEEERDASHGSAATGVVPVIDECLARRLIDDQFPQWSHLPVKPVEFGGVDNRTFRLGDELTMRLPSAEWYVLQVDKEQRWLPVLAPQLPLPIPAPVARGVPGDGYPFPWSVYRWLDGETATSESIGDLTAFATALAGFLVALRRVDTTGGPTPGAHNFFRGGPVQTYAEETLRAVDALGDEVPRGQVLAAWDEAMRATWHGEPVWFHGDVEARNLLVRNGHLAAVIDFGCSGVGDPACDVPIAWALLSGRSRDVFRASLDLDPGTWARGRGWALWKSLITLVEHLEHDPVAARLPRRVIEQVVADHAHDT